ncbi:MAG TPA: C-GCAxxG-C-C family protein [Desulfobacteria bacterium]|nr:C-GCAxxG-C-C family protein [Desulfobacteria bacterium]
MDERMIRMMQLAGKGYICSQIIMKLALELTGEENPSLVRAMAGPGYGCGSGAGTCGAMVGGCCLLALYAAKGTDDETTSERLALMQSELSDWFSQRVGEKYGGIACETIVGGEGAATSIAACGAIVSDTYAKTMEILASNGIDPTAS